MARTLEVVDVTGSKDMPTGDTATLEDDGKVTFNGDQARAIMGRWLATHPAKEVFDKMAGWSNGYVSLMERE